jgi:microcystin-dependent protein
VAQPYVGEIRLIGFNFAPVGWMLCQGQTLPISENEVLFQLIGTTYGGDGEATFQLPNLQSRVPIHMGTAPSGTTYQIGEMAGVENVTLSVQQIPAHPHLMTGSTDIANSPNPGNSILARSPQTNAFINADPGPQMSNQFLSPAGGSQPHENLQPFLCINFIISLFGIFPSQT